LEETILVERLLVLGEWGFPLTRRDVCNLVKIYLDGLGRTSRKETMYHFLSNIAY
jgi:Holliday junction resolvase RusA-like endonuclease